MTQLSEREYLELRLRTCEQMARKAADPGIALIHQQFAAQYAKRLDLKPVRSIDGAH